MPAIAAIVINDGAGTPNARTFAPVTTDGSKAKWADRSPSIAAGYRTITEEVLEPNGQRTAYKTTIGFYFPVVATVNGVDTVVRFSSATVVINTAADSTLQERKDAEAFMINFMSNATVKSSVENLEPFY
jgi:hypothetical protein